MDKLSIFRYYTNVDVVIKKHSQKEPVYGVIIGFEPKPYDKLERWLFLNNLDKEDFNKTGNPNLIIPIEHSDIDNIDFQIKLQTIT
jgi:hypothetical protein